MDRAHNTTANSRVVPEDLEIILDRSHDSSGVAHFVRGFVGADESSKRQSETSLDSLVSDDYGVTERARKGSVWVCSPSLSQPPPQFAEEAMDAMHRV